jgi:hypothetical protein
VLLIIVRKKSSCGSNISNKHVVTKKYKLILGVL